MRQPARTYSYFNIILLNNDRILGEIIRLSNAKTVIMMAHEAWGMILSPH